jgi:hypothetical protein
MLASDADLDDDADLADMRDYIEETTEGARRAIGFSPSDVVD